MPLPCQGCEAQQAKLHSRLPPTLTPFSFLSFAWGGVGSDGEVNLTNVLSKKYTYVGMRLAARKAKAQGTMAGLRRNMDEFDIALMRSRSQSRDGRMTNRFRG